MRFLCLASGRSRNLLPAERLAKNSMESPLPPLGLAEDRFLLRAVDLAANHFLFLTSLLTKDLPNLLVRLLLATRVVAALLPVLADLAVLT